MMDDSPPVARHSRQARKRRANLEPIILESALMQYMIERFVWGFVSPAEVQRVAKILKEEIATALAHSGERDDGRPIVFPQVDSMGKIGNHRVHSQNMHRDLVNNLYSVFRFEMRTGIFESEGFE